VTKEWRWKWESEHRPALCVLDIADRYRRVSHTFVPASNTLPSTLQLKVKGSPPTSSLLTHSFERVSQNRTVPSEEQLANSNSLTGLKRTFSTPCPWPLNSIWLRAEVLSGFQMRMLLSLAPVAISPPDAFHEIVRWLLLSKNRKEESADLMRSGSVRM
jgi:hypothetical protein